MQLTSIDSWLERIVGTRNKRTYDLTQGWLSGWLEYHPDSVQWQIARFLKELEMRWGARTFEMVLTQDQRGCEDLK
jgi:hypothetical protein